LPTIPRSGAIDVANVLAVALLTLAGAAPAGGGGGGGDGPIRLPVTRDTWVSGVGPEADCNLGGAPKLKLKSYQEFTLIDVDPAPLKGRAVRGATLHVHSAGEPRLKRVTVGTIGAEWVEGTAPTYEPQAGSSTFRRRRHPDTPWAAGAGDICGVILGNGGTTWRMADASPPDRDGWQQIPVDPAVVAARVAGVSHGFLVFDDTGSEWARDGEKFTAFPFPNRFVHSRDSNRTFAPYLTVLPGAADHAPPAAPGAVRPEPGTADLPAGEAWASWTTPADDGPAGTAGFFVRVDGKEAPRALIPPPGPPGSRVRIHLRDLDLKPGAAVALEVRAADGAGNLGPAATARVAVSAREPRALPPPGPVPPREDAPLPKLGGVTIAIVDELDKARPDGTLIPDQPAGYLRANHLWSSKDRRVALHAARNEFVAFQVLPIGPAADIRPALAFTGPDGGKLQTALGRYHPVPTPAGPRPDPIVPGAGGGGPIHCEVYVPHDAHAGDHRGTLTLKAGEPTLTVDVTLTVWDFTLPDTLSFLPEMNCYDLPADEGAFYRLAHRHRTVLNSVPYTQTGAIRDGCAPKWDPKARTLDWSAWDRRFGPYLDGSAFADLPRKGVPLDVFYLPIHENWPTPMAGNYNGDYWADRAFPESYRRDLVEVSRQFAAHLGAKGWGGTLFEGFLNNKVDFKARGWSRGSSPWLLDEPASFQDFWALRYFGAAFHEGVGQAPAPAPAGAKLGFRCDISRPQWQRDSLDGVLDYNVVGAAMRPYNRLVMDRKAAQGQVVWEYGSPVAIDGPNAQPAAWCIDAWTLGADGVIPWQTIGTADSWHKADDLALFYPGRTPGEGPVPSARLKSYRRGQQDVEYLTLWARQAGEPPWAVGRRAREALRLDEAERHGTGAAVAEDAGRIDYARLRPADLWALRVRLGRALAEAHPAPRRSLVELRTPRRDPAGLPGREVGGVAP